MNTETFAILTLIAGAALVVAVLSSRVSAWTRIPAPAFFLIAAAIASHFLPALTEDGRTLAENCVTIALVFLLFDGGMHIGWRRFRASGAAITWLGIAGTAVTAAGITFAAHFLLGFDWEPSLLLGAALSPTDPAMVFSVLGGKELGGRSGTILEGESGANDPVGIAIMVALLAAGDSGGSALGNGIIEFLLQMGIGAAVGILGGLLLRVVLTRLALPSDALASVLILACAGVLFGAGAALHGSGFLAVFIAGILVGDVRAPYKVEVDRFSSAIASLAEIAAFAILGLTIPLDVVARPDVLVPGLVIAALLIFVIRPIAIAVLSLPIKVTWAERGFLAWAGLKGAVPLLLGLLIAQSTQPSATRLYGIVAVVVLVSVLLQGTTAPAVARLLRIPLTEHAPRPWALDIRFTEAPEGFRRYVVEGGSPADGARAGDLLASDDAWISLASRNGRALPVGSGTRVKAGDVVLLHPGADQDVSSLFRAPVPVEDAPS